MKNRHTMSLKNKAKNDYMFLLEVTAGRLPMSSLILASFVVNTLGERELQLRNCLHWISLWSCLWSVFLIVSSLVPQ